MTKLKTLLLAIALASPLAALDAAENDQGVEGAAPTTIEMEGQSQYCCWVYHMGRWWCISYC